MRSLDGKSLAIGVVLGFFVAPRIVGFVSSKTK